MNEIRSKVEEAHNQGQKVVTQTSAPGQEVIREQLDEMMQSLSSLESVLKSTNHDLREKMTQWEQYEESEAAFGVWLDDAERTVAMDMGQMMELSDKVTELEKRKVCHSFLSLL